MAASEDSALPSIAITLSPTQVDSVLRAAAQSRAPSVSALLNKSADVNGLGEIPVGLLPAYTDDRRLSRSLLRGLSLLACFGSNNEARGIVELAHELNMSPSTAHRYALTLVYLGLLERSPDTRKYKLPELAADEED